MCGFWSFKLEILSCYRLCGSVLWLVVCRVMWSQTWWTFLNKCCYTLAARGCMWWTGDLCLSPGILHSLGHMQVNVTALSSKNCLNLYIYGEFKLSRGANSPGSLRHSCSLISYSWVKQLIGNVIRSFSSYLEGHLWKEAFLFPCISSLSLSVRENWAKNTNFFHRKLK